MLSYECEKPVPDWTRHFPSSDGSHRSLPNSRDQSTRDRHADYARRFRPLPPRPDAVICQTIHTTKPTVPLKVWIIASASCFGVCGALVLGTVLITKWGASDSYQEHEYYPQPPAPLYHHLPNYKQPLQSEQTNEEETMKQYPYLEKLSMFQNIVNNREKNKKIETLLTKPQPHPVHDESIQHPLRKIEKKHQAIPPDEINEIDTKINLFEHKIPEFKPTLPDVFIDRQIKFSEGYGAPMADYEDFYYNDDNLYQDYLQSNSMTNYLIEKVQELHDWITTDPDFKNATKFTGSQKNNFSQLLKALNETLIEGNVTIIMNKLKHIYFGENFTLSHSNRKVILNNGTDLLSFGILTLDVMLLHNIQLLAWENQESLKNKMLSDPDVFAFNSLFLDPGKVETTMNEVQNNDYGHLKRQNLRQTEEKDPNKGILENILDMGMSTARAAVHLGRAYKNAKMVLSQTASRDTFNTNFHHQMSKNLDGNTRALSRLQETYEEKGFTGNKVTELSCVWLVYCKNLVVTGRLPAPYGLMARINGLALRMLTGELPADRALDTMLYELFSGWTSLRCTDMFPGCAKLNAASIVLESVLQPLKKTQNSQLYK